MAIRGGGSLCEPDATHMKGRVSPSATRSNAAGGTEVSIAATPVLYRSLHLLQCSHANQTHRLMPQTKLLGESPQRDRDLGKPARLEDVALPIIKHARRLRKYLRSCFFDDHFHL